MSNQTSDSTTNERGEQPVLEVKGLKTYFHTEDGLVKAVDGISVEAFPGETRWSTRGRCWTEHQMAAYTHAMSLVRYLSPISKLKSSHFCRNWIWTCSSQPMQQLGSLHRGERGRFRKRAVGRS